MKTRTVALALAVLELALCWPAAAYYNPRTGRWLSRDSVGERGGENLYGFVRNQVEGGVDALGDARMLTGSLLQSPGDTSSSVSSYGLAEARQVLRLLEELRAMKDAHGRRCYNAYVKDLVTTPLPTVKKHVALWPEHVYLVAHGALIVNGTKWPYKEYKWISSDTVAKAIDIEGKGEKLTPLSALGPSLRPENVFGCYLSTSVDKKKPSAWPGVYSTVTTYPLMYQDLHKKLAAYKSRNTCDCVISVVIYEGERTDGVSEPGTDYTLAHYPLQPEEWYTKKPPP